MSGIEVSKADLARTWGVSLPTITSWVNRGCPFLTRGGPGKAWTFNTAEVAEWREQQAALSAAGDTKSLDLDEARRLKLAAEAGIAEIDLAQRRREVIPIDEVADVVGDDYANVRAKLLSMPTKLAPQLIGIDDPKELQSLVERSVYEALEELTADGIYSNDSASPGAEAAEAQQPETAA